LNSSQREILSIQQHPKSTELRIQLQETSLHVYATIEEDIWCPWWVNASYGGSLLWQNGVFSLGTFYSNAYDDLYILKSINWDLDKN
jgi:hypothetical protein